MVCPDINATETTSFTISKYFNHTILPTPNATSAPLQKKIKQLIWKLNKLNFDHDNLKRKHENLQAKSGYGTLENKYEQIKYGKLEYL